MLQQVLKDMYIDPEILAELDEDQKQVLFCKMRQEQVRRWQEDDEKLEKEAKKLAKKNKKNSAIVGKRVDFVLGCDGNPWVWVMGEHVDDQTIEDIIEEEAQREADQEAEQELEQLQEIETEKFAHSLQEEQAKIEREEQEKEEQLRKEAAELKSKKEALKQIEEKKKEQENLMRRKIKEVQRNIERRKRASISNIQEAKEKRSSQIYLTMKEMREKILKLAERDKPQLEELWQEQEKKAKQAETEKRAIARKAREEHRQSLSFQTESQMISALMQSYHHVQQIGDKKPLLPKKPLLKPRAAKPPDRAAVVSWFQQEEEDRGAGVDPLTEQAAVWFHGIIGRQDAEDLLEDQKPGSFLVRVSEKVYGYAVSMRSPVRCKHFLIDVTHGGYKFFGTNQITHNTLASLVAFHKDEPISIVGQEILVYPCGQQCDPPDTAELFANSSAQTSYL